MGLKAFQMVWAGFFLPLRLRMCHTWQPSTFYCFNVTCLCPSLTALLIHKLVWVLMIYSSFLFPVHKVQLFLSSCAFPPLSTSLPSASLAPGELPDGFQNSVSRPPGFPNPCALCQTSCCLAYQLRCPHPDSATVPHHHGTLSPKTWGSSAMSTPSNLKSHLLRSTWCIGHIFFWLSAWRSDCVV